MRRKSKKPGPGKATAGVAATKKRGRKLAKVEPDLKHLMQAKKFVEQMGGMAKARAAVDALAQILD